MNILRNVRKTPARVAATGSVTAALLLALAPTSHASVLLDDGFEGDFKPMWTRNGEVSVTNQASHGFSYSFVSYPTMNADPDVGVITATLPAVPIGYASVWFFDDLGGGKEQFFQVRNGAAIRPGIGVTSWAFPNHYACSRTSGQDDANSFVPRTRAWHEFRVEWALAPAPAGVRYTLKIDGAPVCGGLTAASLPNQVNIGDGWSYVRTEGSGFWDDFSFGNQL